MAFFIFLTAAPLAPAPLCAETRPGGLELGASLRASWSGVYAPQMSLRGLIPLGRMEDPWEGGILGLGVTALWATAADVFFPAGLTDLGLEASWEWAAAPFWAPRARAGLLFGWDGPRIYAYADPLRFAIPGQGSAMFFTFFSPGLAPDFYWDSYSFNMELLGLDLRLGWGREAPNLSIKPWFKRELMWRDDRGERPRFTLWTALGFGFYADSADPIPLEALTGHTGTRFGFSLGRGDWDLDGAFLVDFLSGWYFPYPTMPRTEFTASWRALDPWMPSLGLGFISPRFWPCLVLKPARFGLDYWDTGRAFQVSALECRLCLVDPDKVDIIIDVINLGIGWKID